MIKDYERRTGEHVSLEGFISMKIITTKTNTITISNGSPNAGFLFWTINEHEGQRYFTIWQTYGDMKVTGKYIVEVMKMNNLDVIVTATHRRRADFIKSGTWNAFQLWTIPIMGLITKY